MAPRVISLSLLLKIVGAQALHLVRYVLAEVLTACQGGLHRQQICAELLQISLYTRLQSLDLLISVTDAVCDTVRRDGHRAGGHMRGAGYVIL